jgi:hypothetical protein
MSLEFKMDSARIKRDGKMYFVFILIFVVIAYFYYTTGGKYYTSISKTLKATKEIETDIRSLEAKISSLKSIKDSTISDINALNISFPPEDPSLFMYSQLKVLSFNNNVELVDILFSSGSALDEISASMISFSVRGIKENVYNFISDLGKVAPLSGLGGMTFSDYVDSGGVIELSMAIDIFYSPFPKVLPDTDEVINSLTMEENDVYNTLTSLEVMSKAIFEAQEPNENLDDPFEGGFINPEITNE